jgi:cobalt/nickel transport system permease protein
MIRYGAVLRDQLRQTAIARRSRGDDPRWLWQASAVARTAGTHFVRAYERGERVYLAMLARGYESAPTLATRAVAPGGWLRALAVPTVAAAISASAVLT